jgi:hypothetical protein
VAKKEQKPTGIVAELILARFSENGASLPADPVARERWPFLFDLLTNTGEESEYLIEPARIGLGLGVGCWTVSVSHMGLQMRKEASCASLEGAFEALERAVADPNIGWRNWGKEMPKLRKRKNAKTQN